MKNIIFLLLMCIAWCHSLLYGEKHKTSIVVCCSGKSGSTTLEESFLRAGLPTVRYHGLNHDQAFDLLNSAESLILIDSIRDPIARKISSFFHNITLHVGLSEDEILSIYQSDGLSFFLNEFEKVVVDLAQWYGFTSWNHYHYDCLKEGTFDFRKKYQFRQIGNLYFINLRFDDIEDWQKIIRSIPLPIKLEKFTIISTNRGDQKWYGDIYRDFCAHFTISQVLFDTILNNNKEEIVHFWGKKGLQNFIDKWASCIRD